MKAKKPIDKESARLRLAGVCASTETCESEAWEKLRRWGLGFAEAEEVIDELIEGRYIDDGRYARAYASDKLRFAGWGRNKIRMMLSAKRISPALITEALDSLDHDLYARALMKVARTRAKGLDLADYNDRAKLMRRLMSRGFESGLVVSAVNELREEE